MQILGPKNDPEPVSQIERRVILRCFIFFSGCYLYHKMQTVNCLEKLLTQTESFQLLNVPQMRNFF